MAYKTDKTLCIAFNGPAGTGKDTLAALIPGTKVSIADQVRIGAAKFFGYPELIELSHDRVMKDTYDKRLSMTPREALINYSETVAKPKYGKHVFLQDAIRRILPEQVTKITDTGFQFELDAICDVVDVVFLVSLYKEGYTFEGDSRGYLVSNRPNCHGIEIRILEGKPEEQAAELVDTINYILEFS